MKIVQLISAYTIIAAAAAAIVLTAVRIHKAGKADRRSIVMIAVLSFLIVVMIVNLIVVIPNI